MICYNALMSLNCNEINLILDELDLPGSFIQQIVQPGFDSLALYCYKNGRSTTLFICLAPGATRLHSTQRKIPKNDKPLRFMEFLKSRIKGCRINSCTQIGLDRIVRMDISNSQEEFVIFLRLWSSAANIIVTDKDYNILDVFFRRPKKGEVSGGVFQLPESEPLTEAQLAEAAEKYPVRSQNPEDTADVSDKAESADKAENENKADSPFVPEGQEFNDFIDRWYAENAQTLSRTALLEQAEKLYKARKERMTAALSRLESKKQSFLSAEQWKHQGDLILSFGHLIDGTTNYLDCEDYETGAQVRIVIDPKKRVQENAQIYYEKYKKAVSGLEDLEHDIQKAKKELRDLEFTYEMVCKEPNPIRMQQMIRKETKPKQQIVKKHPGVTYQVNGWTIFVGREADENDELLRHHVRGADTWLHTRDWPGGYVFIKAQSGKTVPLEILLDAGNLAVHYSKARQNKAADLYVTQVKYLRRAKDGPKGKVLPTHEKNLSITIDEARLRRLDECRV